MELDTLSIYLVTPGCRGKSSVRLAAASRNATISALSRLVCVIDPKRKSGSMHTAQAATRMGKKLLVRCRDEDAELEQELLRDGAETLDNESGNLSDALLTHWHAAPDGAARQNELF